LEIPENFGGLGGDWPAVTCSGTRKDFVAIQHCPLMFPSVAVGAGLAYIHVVGKTRFHGHKRSTSAAIGGLTPQYLGPLLILDLQWSAAAGQRETA
jgi:hypothetical protein